MTDSPPNRRDFLSGRAIRGEVEQAGARVADDLAAIAPPSRGPTLMLRTTAMATDFDVLLNPAGPPVQLSAASAALDLVHQLEQQYSVYRDDSELAGINREAAKRTVSVEPDLLRLLARSVEISHATQGAFNPAAGQLIATWRRARQEERLPSEEELTAGLQAAAVEAIAFQLDEATIHFLREGPQFDLGAIGKGYAVDRAGAILSDQGVESWLVHGGKSSVRVQGGHAEHDGWPIALQNPLLPDRPFLTLLLRDQALSTSGTAVQWFRHQGRRYGHVLDPRTGRPVEQMLSVSVIAPDAALADALSTAFFVLGVENALRCCDNFPSTGAILFPFPADGRTLAPIIHGIPPNRVFLRD